MSENEELTREVEWTYGGVRVLKDGTLGHLWIKEDGERVVFKKFAVSVVGGIYAIRANELRTAVDSQSARWTQERDANASVLELEHRAARAEYESKAAEKRMAREGSLGDLTLAQLKEQLAQASALHRRGMIAAVLQYLRV